LELLMTFGDGGFGVVLWWNFLKNGWAMEKINY
jgi:hypothetical protein